MVGARLCGMLQAMQQTAATAPSSSPNFAGILAAFAAPAKERTQAWNDDGLADDYATLSYERALRAHARYRSADASIDESDSSLAQPTDSEPIRNREAPSTAAPPVGPTAIPRMVSPAKTDVQAKTVHGLPTALDRNLKSSSITIRLSKAECAQLRNRAAEAGLTVSAYLRSCTFEAESLRALVKDTLAQLRSGAAQGVQAAMIQSTANQAVSRPIRRSLRQWWARFWPHTHTRRRVAQA
jgi:mobilization protein NikA